MHRSHGMEEMHRDSVVEIANELANVWRCMNRLMRLCEAFSVNNC